MKIKDEFKIYLKSLQRTRKIATILAKNIKKGLCICLYGDLGTGKTTFSRFFINSLSKKNINVPSPTFSMVQLYELKNFNIWLMNNLLFISYTFIIYTRHCLKIIQSSSFGR